MVLGVEDHQAADLRTAVIQIQGLDPETIRIRTNLVTTREQTPSHKRVTTIVITFFPSLANLTLLSVCDIWLAVILFVVVHFCLNPLTSIGAQSKHHTAGEAGRRGETSAEPTSKP